MFDSVVPHRRPRGRATRPRPAVRRAALALCLVAAIPTPAASEAIPTAAAPSEAIPTAAAPSEAIPTPAAPSARTAAPAEAEAPDALERIRALGRLRLGYRRDAPPFSYDGPDGRPAGLAVRLCAAVAPTVAAAAADPEAGLPGPGPEGADALAPPTVEWVPVTAADRFDALAEGRTDLHCGPATQTLSRRLRTDFSIPYFVDGAGLVFRRGGPERLRDLTDESVGALSGTTTEGVLRGLLAERAPAARVVTFDSHVAGLEALERGEIEAYMADRSILLYQLGALRPAVQPVIGARTWSREPYALAMRRGESRLRLAVDAALSRLYASGEIYELIRESLGRVEIGPEIEAIYDVVSIPE